MFVGQLDNDKLSVSTVNLNLKNLGKHGRFITPIGPMNLLTRSNNFAIKGNVEEELTLDRSLNQFNLPRQAFDVPFRLGALFR